MKNYTITILILVLGVFLFQMGCENDYPDSIWEPSYTSKPTPIINDIDPDISFSGIGVITLTGQNFSANVEENDVFIGGAAATVLSATTTSLEVQVPTLVEDSLLVQVHVDGAYEYGEYGKEGSGDVPFSLKDALVKYLAVDATKEISGLACDLSDSIYTILSGLPGRVVKIAYPDCTSLYEYAQVPSPLARGMKWGPGGYLYFVRKNNHIYRVTPGGAAAEFFIRNLDEKLIDLDFDENENIFTAGEGGKIFRVSPSVDTATVAHYDEFYNLNVLRVYDGYLYSFQRYDLNAGGDSTVVQRGIWRNQILDASGTLGANEFMFDWDSYVGKSGQGVTSMVIDENGTFYLGNSYVNNNNNEAITKLDINSGLAEPLYPEILNMGVENLCWGNSNYLYIHRYIGIETPDGTEYTREMFRLAMPLNSAPYYGRQ